ncbi:MAG: M50 family metallopeptidase, partial [Blastocatellia bacterium]
MTTDPFRIVDAPPVTADPAARDALDSFRHVLAASALTFILWFIPFVGLILYPIRVFVTYVHELCHAFAAVLTLGWPMGIQIFMDTSGVTHTLGGSSLAISSAGYVCT